VYTVINLQQNNIKLTSPVSLERYCYNALRSAAYIGMCHTQLQFHDCLKKHHSEKRGQAVQYRNIRTIVQNVRLPAKCMPLSLTRHRSII